MINFLHTFVPNSVIISFGPFNIFYYGVFIVIGILIGSVIIFKLAEHYDIDKNMVIDSAFYVVLSAIAGGRLYHVFLELPYYLEHPLNIFMLWKGGLAIHGAIIGGIIAIYYFSKKNKLNPLLLAALYTPALALGQALGRWGNYFNQELFGLPTDLPWGIPIQTANRVAPYLNSEYFHPTFLYESFGNLLIFIFLFWLHKLFIKRNSTAFALIIAFYLFFYSILRFSLEFIRIDKTPVIFGLRLPQYASVVLILVTIYIFYINRKELSALFKKNKDSQAL